ncbi:hypothetical protein Sjap_021143 [Stephania japonica]|uniref:CCT domain-containing protein n=1 Tax=Stephania japonica TaxID=461633 RepID=A0AAP0I185_9MAGN
MYAETELLYPYLQCFTPGGAQPFDEFFEIEKSHEASMCNQIPTCSVSDYDLGGEGDLFKAPEPIIEELVISLDPMTTVVSMIPDAPSSQAVNALEIELIQGEHLLDDVFYKSERDLVSTSDVIDPILKIQDEKPPIKPVEDPLLEKDMFLSRGEIQRSISSGCLHSMEWRPHNVLRPNFLEFQKVHFEAADGIRRAFSEGDIQTLSNGNINLHGSTYREMNTEGRLEKLTRYRKKKTRRNFGRTIKYACRKALADNQPRVRGRFAKSEESNVSK